MTWLHMGFLGTTFSKCFCLGLPPINLITLFRWVTLLKHYCSLDLPGQQNGGSEVSNMNKNYFVNHCTLGHSSITRSHAQKKMITMPMPDSSPSSCGSPLASAFQKHIFLAVNPSSACHYALIPHVFFVNQCLTKMAWQNGYDSPLQQSLSLQSVQVCSFISKQMAC